MIDLTSFESIIFDLGGVVVDLDLNYTINAFRKQGIPNISDFISPGLHSDIFLKLEMGEISEKEFYNGIREMTKTQLPDEDIRKAWCSMLVRLPEKRVRILEDLKKHYKIILLSNTNIVHHKYFDGFAKGYNSLAELFHKVYYSYLMHDHKPNASIFQTVIRNEGLNIKKTLFLDDAPDNIIVSKKTGMTSILITPEKQMENIF